jgi:uncharacterized RDD family membrane protein YckC
MYTIIGGDGKEYGPVTAQQVQAWIAAGRANLETQAKAAGTSEWKRLRDYPEFGRGAPPLLADEPPPPEGSLAGRLSRLGAFLLDAFLAAVCLMPLMNPNLATLSNHSSYSLAFSDVIQVTSLRDFAAKGWPLILLEVIQVVLLSVRGQTIAKRLFRIRIVRHRDGSNPGFTRAFLLRSLLPEMIEMIPFLGAVFVIADACFIFRSDRRCLHDWIADTSVVRVQNPPL